MTTSRPLIPLNYANDKIIGIYNTFAGGSNGGIDGIYNHSYEGPENAMDNNLTTVYLNTGRLKRPGLGTGFIVIPFISNSTVACGIRFGSGRFYHRHPLTITLEGSAASTIDALNLTSSWILLYNGSTGIPPNSTNQTYYDTQFFNNTKTFQSYRLLVTLTGGTSLGAEYSEARIMGYI